MNDSVSIAFTAAGAPQAATLIRQLRNNGERPVRLIALDMNSEVVGRYLADVYYQIPRAGAKGYQEAIIRVIEQEKPDAIINCSENDVPFIARMRREIERRGTKVICPDAEAVDLLTDKYRLYTALKDLSGVEIPEFTYPRSLEDFVQTARRMGYPDRDLCFKPHRSKGSRGFRILTERYNRRDLLLNHKPTARYMPLDEFVSIFREEEEFPDLLLMEMATGEECDVMTLAHKGDALLTTVKLRESHRWGVIDRGELIERPEIISSAAKIVERLDLSHNVYLQFIGGRLIEMGPRTSTYIYKQGFVEPWLSVKLAIGLITPEEVRTYQKRVPYNRRMIRYMDQIFFDPDGQWSD